MDNWILSQTEPSFGFAAAIRSPFETFIILSQLSFGK